MNFFVPFVPLPGPPAPGPGLSSVSPPNPVSPRVSSPSLPTTFPPPFFCFPFVVSHSHLLPLPLSFSHLPFPPPSAFCFYSGSPRSAVTSCWALDCCGWVVCGCGPPPTQAWLLVSGCQGSASFVVIISSYAQRLALVPLLPRTWCIYGVYRRSVSRGVDRANGWLWASVRLNHFYLGILWERVECNSSDTSYKVKLPRFRQCFHQLLAECRWRSCSMFPCLCFLISKWTIIVRLRS